MCFQLCMTLLKDVALLQASMSSLDVHLTGITTISYHKPVCHLSVAGPPSSPTKRQVPDEAGDVHVHKGSHQVLTVKAVHDTSVPGDCVGEVLCKADGIGFSRFRCPLPVPAWGPLGTNSHPCSNSSQKAAVGLRTRFV